jgi:hypothetical protein
MGSLGGCRQKVHALALLNSIGELGEPVGEGLEQRFVSLESALKQCEVDDQGAGVDAAPRCPGCRIALGEAPPQREVRLLAADVEAALGEQNRRLSAVLVQRILRGGVDPQMESFLKIVQASDLSALSNTLDDKLALFIRELLRNP